MEDCYWTYSYYGLVIRITTSGEKNHSKYYQRKTYSDGYAITSDIYQCVIPKRKISPQACNLICLETESLQQKCSVNYEVTSKNN